MKEYSQYQEKYNRKNFGLRLSSLREKKGISARKMSLELGQNKNYINCIESGIHYPNMNCFFEICFYLNIEPSEFFSENTTPSGWCEDVAELLCQLPPHIFQHFYQILYDFIEQSEIRLSHEKFIFKNTHGRF